MMRLEPTHRLLAGVNGASLVSVPLAVLLLFFVYLVPKHGTETGRAVSPSSPAIAVPIPPASSNGTDSPQTIQPRESPREATPQPQRAIVSPKKVPGERVLYSVRWTVGEIRRKIAGNPPQFPAGFGGEAMVRVELVVTSGGAVRSAKLLQVGNARCDDATLREVRLWKFQPLPPRQKRMDQRCVVIVSFTRK